MTPRELMQISACWSRPPGSIAFAPCGHADETQPRMQGAYWRAAQCSLLFVAAFDASVTSRISGFDVLLRFPLGCGSL